MKRCAASDDGSLDSDASDASPKRSAKRSAFTSTGGAGPNGFAEKYGSSNGNFGEASADSQLESLLAAGQAQGKGGTGLWFNGASKGLPKGSKPDTGGFGMKGVEPTITLEPKVETTAMDFTKLGSHNMSTSSVTVQKRLVESLMTLENRRVLCEESGTIVEWVPDEAKVMLSGSAEQVKRAQRLLARVMMHCRWGYGEEKVRRLLKPKKIESVLCRLSPMNTLRPAERVLSSTSPLFTIGKDKTNDVTILDPLISRQHTVMELDEERGAVYVLDCSTNGTFLNGFRLPSKKVGKVILSHGDELLFKDPAGGEQEFGYIVNLTELYVKEETKLEAPRRLLKPDEMGGAGRDFA
eukprot:TRINITY_DN49867_c0_g1_i1.p1 TRINITY_DN49867_c0_g1~~TRINITY_DN49867_c0_g1_i1.p1  ORF type:complete len:353 (-),score=77.15 TRINITY_DN49867_c0_g1_i1:299-1357(-)